MGGDVTNPGKGLEPDGDPDAKSGGDPEANSGGDPEANSGGDPDANSGAGPEANSGADPEANSGAAPDAQAIASLERLGLAANEAKLLLGLQRLGSATARELSEATDVPRSQVYGTADALEERGLVYVQHANPKQYQPVDAEEVETILRDRFEANLETAVDRLGHLEREQGGNQETREEIWTITGSDAIEHRIQELIAAASVRIVFGIVDVELLSDAVVEALRERAADGLDVLVISRDEAVRDRFDPVEGVHAIRPPQSIAAEDDQTGRMVMIDDESILHSVIGTSAVLGDSEETAFWSQRSGFAKMVIGLLKESLDEEP